MEKVGEDNSKYCEYNDSSREALVVLVTGASGFIGTHCVRQLLEEGYCVRGTVRSLKVASKVDPVLALNRDNRLELVEADLLQPESWPPAVAGCDFVLHVASPFPIVADKQVIKTAIDGTLNVLKAVAQVPRVKKVVLTSSCAAINEGHPNSDHVFDENDWTNVDHPTVLDYAKSKTLAEKAAWDFVNNLPPSKRFPLTAINPTLVVGPVLITEQGASVSIIRRFLNTEMPAVPALQLACVDVRDVALAHTRAMRCSESDGERILATAQPSFWFRQIAGILSSEFRSQGYWVPRLQVPYLIVWLFSIFDAEAAAILNRLGHEVKFSNTKAKKLLDLDFRDPTQSFIEMGYTLIERGIVRKTSGYHGVPDRFT